MHVFLLVALAVALVAVVVVLGLGFYALFRGGEFGRRWSNKLMQLRVIIQFAAIAILASIFWLAQASHGR
jgi:hypoxia induced protein